MRVTITIDNIAKPRGSRERQPVSAVSGPSNPILGIFCLLRGMFDVVNALFGKAQRRGGTLRERLENIGVTSYTYVLPLPNSRPGTRSAAGFLVVRSLFVWLVAVGCVL